MRSEFQDSDMPEILTQIYNHNFTEAQYVVDKEVALISQVDKRFLQIIDKVLDLKVGTTKLPFRNEDFVLSQTIGQRQRRDLHNFRRKCPEMKSLAKTT